MNAISSPTQQKHAVKNIICIGETDFVAIKWNASLAAMQSPQQTRGELVTTLGYALSNDNLTESNYGVIASALANYASMCNTPSLVSADYAALFVFKIGHRQYASQWVGCLSASSDYDAMSGAMFMLRIILGSDKAKRRNLKKSKIVKTLIAGGAV
jgi:hypothetical protein